MKQRQISLKKAHMSGRAKTIGSKYNDDQAPFAYEPDGLDKRDEYVLKNQDMVRQMIEKSKAALNIRNTKEAYLSVANAYNAKRYEHLILNYKSIALYEQWKRKDNEYIDIILNNLNAAIEIDPNYIVALQRQGELKEDTERGSGIKYFERVLAIDKNNIEAIQQKINSYYARVLQPKAIREEEYKQLLINKYRRLESLGGLGDNNYYVNQYVCEQEHESRLKANRISTFRGYAQEYADEKESLDEESRKEYDTCLKYGE